jgi:hypothetical protein
VLEVMSPADGKVSKNKERVSATVKMAFNQWTDCSDTVAVSYLPECSDALVGVSLGAGQTPLLVTNTAELDKRLLAELKRLQPKSVVLLDDAGVLPDTIGEQIREALQTDVEIVRKE